MMLRIPELRLARDGPLAVVADCSESSVSTLVEVEQIGVIRQGGGLPVQIANRRALCKGKLRVDRACGLKAVNCRSTP